MSALHVQLECQLPGELAVGRGTALFACGWCFCAEHAVRRLWFELGDERQPVAAHGMPRLDPFRALHPTLDPFAIAGLETDHASSEDPELRSYRSGFWGLVRIGPGELDGTRRLSLVAELDDGQELSAPLGEIAPRRPAEPVSVSWPGEAAGARVAIAMATYNPPADLLAAQLESIRAQTHADWVCVISDDGSSHEKLSVLEGLIAGDERFRLVAASRRVGFYGNFERALELAPADADFIALADQDDVWDPDKLETLLAEIGEAPLVYSDARVVARDGRRLAETWWERRRNNHTDLLSLLVANAVTGAASLIRRDLLDTALPFPPAQFAHFHDHWIGLAAAAAGEIAYVPRPLYDYVQHGQASLGHAAANRIPSLRDRLLRRPALRDRVSMWRLHYFVDVCRLQQLATILLMRAGTAMSRGKRRTLRRFVSAERSPLAILGLARRGAADLLGTPETLGAEWMLFRALLWRWLLGSSARDRPQARLRLDALPPASLIQEPGRAGLPEGPAALQEKTAPLRWAVVEDAPRRINLLIPGVDLQHLFGGYIAKFNLARRLTERGLRVRIVTVDPVGPLPGSWRGALESYAGLAGLLDRVELAFGREASELEISPADSFIATTWWTAHIAEAALGSVRADRFLYLIQEYEPFTFAMGSWAAMAADSYRLAHFGLFSSELLRGYFRAHGIGVYAAGSAAGDGASVSFQNAITPVPAPSPAELERRGPGRLLFYARPEPHAARNMFELGVLALVQVLREGEALEGWELNGIGTVTAAAELSLGPAKLNLIPRAGQEAYAELLREHDLGLALMYTPHPSLVPIEMASAGMVTVTNSFENKTAEALSAISANLLTVEPSVSAVAGGLRQAVVASGDFAARARASAVNWSSRWEDSFSDALLDRLAAVLWPG